MAIQFTFWTINSMFREVVSTLGRSRRWRKTYKASWNVWTSWQESRSQTPVSLLQLSGIWRLTNRPCRTSSLFKSLDARRSSTPILMIPSTSSTWNSLPSLWWVMFLNFSSILHHRLCDGQVASSTLSFLSNSWQVDLADSVAPTDIEEGMRVGVDRNKYQIHIPLPPKIDPTVTMMQVEEKPDVTYSDVGGCKEQIEKLREVVETPLLHVSSFSFLYLFPFSIFSLFLSLPSFFPPPLLIFNSSIWCDWKCLLFSLLDWFSLSILSHLTPFSLSILSLSSYFFPFRFFHLSYTSFSRWK